MSTVKSTKRVLSNLNKEKQMSEVEQFYNAVMQKMNVTQVPWNDLHPLLQIQFIQGINDILQVVERVKRGDY